MTNDSTQPHKLAGRRVYDAFNRHFRINDQGVPIHEPFGKDREQVRRLRQEERREENRERRWVYGLLKTLSELTCEYEPSDSNKDVHVCAPCLARKHLSSPPEVKREIAIEIGERFGVHIPQLQEKKGD